MQIKIKVLLRRYKQIEMKKYPANSNSIQIIKIAHLLAIMQKRMSKIHVEAGPIPEVQVETIILQAQCKL